MPGNKKRELTRWPRWPTSLRLKCLRRWAEGGGEKREFISEEELNILRVFTVAAHGPVLLLTERSGQLLFSLFFRGN